jgi:hypothetical protein
MNTAHSRGIFLLMLSLVAGCGDLTDRDHSNLQVWHSPTSSIHQRELAASRLVSNGDSKAHIQTILGPPTRIEHWYGPSGSGELRDEDRLIYEFADGTFFCLRFNVLASRMVSEDRPLVGVFSGFTNAFRSYDIRPIAPESK